MKLTIKSLIKSWELERELFLSIGHYETILLKHLLKLRMDLNEEEFSRTIPLLAKDLNFTENTLQNCLLHLCDWEFISITRKGLPSRNFYTIHDQKIINHLSPFKNSFKAI